MTITNIPSPRVDFIDERTPNKISKAWFLFLYELFHRVGGISGDTTIVEVEEMFQPRVTDLIPSSFITNEPSGFSEQSLQRPFLDIDPRIELALISRMEAGLGQLRQEIRDAHSLAELAPVMPPSTDSGGGTELNCLTVEAVGYWSPVTDGAMGLIDNGDGEVVVAFTCTE